jgi:ribosomal-protein-alanine N-acetyltransferase
MPMLFLKTLVKPAPRLRIEGARLYIRPPGRADAADWAALRLRNRDFHRPWSPSSSLYQLTPEGYLRRLRGYRHDWQQDRGYAFLIFAREGDRLMGGITLNGIIRAAGQMANLGYWLDEAQTRKGYMSEAVKLACGFGFATLGLHRIQAGTLPENTPSQKVLQNCGFTYEGVARRYIRIADEWRDHHLYALLAEDFLKRV